MKKHLIICFAFMATFTNAAFAQKDLPSESVEVIKDFEVRLLEASKIDLAPSLPAVSPKTNVLDYTLTARPANVKYDPPKLRPVGMKKEKNDPLYNGYLKAGAGIPASLLLNGGYSFAVKDKLNARVYFNHLSANYKEYENQRFMNNEGGITGTYFMTKNMALDGKLSYSYDRVHYYGYDHTLYTYEEEATRQNYKLLDTEFRLYNSKRSDIDLNFFIQPKLYRLTDFFANKETGFDLSMGATKWFSQKHPFTLIIRTDFTTFKDTITSNLNNIYLKPSFTLHYDMFNLKLGANFASNRDQWTVFPDAELTARIWGDAFQVFLGANGDLRKNTFRTLTEYNPFLDLNQDKLRNTTIRTYYGGIKGNLGTIDYTVQASYNQANDLALFQPNFVEPITRFTAIYDSVNFFNIQGGVKLYPTKDLTITGTLSQNIYDPKNESKAWGLPGLEGNFSAMYKLLDGKASVKAEAYLADGINFRDEAGVKESSKALFDLSLGGTYQITNNIGAFLDINNLLNNKRERWYRYPIFGTNIMGGVTVKF